MIVATVTNALLWKNWYHSNFHRNPLFQGPISTDTIAAVEGQTSTTINNYISNPGDYGSSTNQISKIGWGDINYVGNITEEGPDTWSGIEGYYFRWASNYLGINVDSDYYMLDNCAIDTDVWYCQTDVNDYQYTMTSMAPDINSSTACPTCSNWTLSGSGTNEYYLQNSDNGDIRIAEPSSLEIADVTMTKGTLGSLSDHYWNFGDNDSLGYDTVYVRDNSGDPDSTAVKIESIYTIDQIESLVKNTSPVIPLTITPEDADSGLVTEILNDSGAFPAFRVADETRWRTEAINGTGDIPINTSPLSYPTVTLESRNIETDMVADGYTAFPTSPWTDTDGDGRYNFLEWIDGLTIYAETGEYSETLSPWSDYYGYAETRACFDHGMTGILKYYIVDRLALGTSLTGTTRNGTSMSIGSWDKVVYDINNVLGANDGALVLFEVSGIIGTNDSQAGYQITHPFVYIAGQTAPSPGITFIDTDFEIRASDVIFTHVRVRGSTDDNDVPIAVVTGGATTDVQDVIIDHCSTSWAVYDANMLIYKDLDTDTLENITISNCISSESMVTADNNAKGMNIMNASNVSLISNFYHSNYFRSPYCRAESLYGANNLSYNANQRSLYVAAPSFTSTVDIDWINNVTIGGPMSGSFATYYNATIGSSSTAFPDTYDIFLSGNQADGAVAIDNAKGDRGFTQTSADDWDRVDQWLVGVDRNTGSGGYQYTNTQESSATLTPPTDFTPLAANAVEASIIANVGARPTDRDTPDTEAIAQLQANSGISTQRTTEPSYSLNTDNWNISALPGDHNSFPSNPLSVDDSRTRAEDWLNELKTYWESEEDTTPPVISSPLPSGVQACTSDPRDVDISITTNENATCKYSLTNVAYDSMASTFSTTGSTNHSQTISSLACDDSYTYYTRCEDGSSNENTSSTTISFSIDSSSLYNFKGTNLSGGISFP